MDELEFEESYFSLTIFAFFVSQEQLEHDKATKRDERLYAHKVLSDIEEKDELVEDSNASLN